MKKITRIENDLNAITDGEFFSCVIENIEPCPYYNNETAYRISGIVYKKVDGNIWATKTKTIFGGEKIEYKATEWHIADDCVVERLLKENLFAIYTNGETVTGADSFCVAINHKSNEK